MGEILFLAHRLPFPPDRGDKIRSHHILRHLATLAPVHVATFADDAADMAHEHELASIAASHCLVRRAKPLALAGVEALLRRHPVSLTAFASDKLARYVRKTLATRPIETIYVFSGQMGQYIPDDFAGRVIADFVDVDSAKFEAFGQGGSNLRAWIDAREGRLLRDEEAWLASRAQVSLLISAAEAALFRQRLPGGSPADVRVLANGIDAIAFDPAAVAPEGRMLEDAGPRLIFTGQMDYAPNIAAVERAVERILPRVRQHYPDATLHVVGRNPPPGLLARHGQHGVRVLGRVDDIRPWLRAADLALVPLEIARGVQNKVLEAMAMALPVVLTEGAATGIEALDGSDFQIARDDEALAAAVIALIAERPRALAMGRAARRFVLDHASWRAALAPLAGIVGAGHGRYSDAA